MSSLAEPYFLLLLLLIPLFLEEDWCRKVLGKLLRRNEAVNFAATELVSKLPQSPRQRIRSLLLTSLLLGSFLCLVVALARPREGHTQSTINASGRDIMLVLDVSKSMEAMDFFVGQERVNRLQALKGVVKYFIQQRRGDRMGLVVFGNQAFTQCPLTLDHNVLTNFVDYLSIGMAGNGTAIGSALAVALKRFRTIESDSRVIVLVTDGKSNSGEVRPKEAAELAKKFGIKIYTIGIGGPGVAPFLSRDFTGRPTLRNQMMEFDEETLIDIANITSAKYFRADDIESLQEIYKEINKIEERKEEMEVYVSYQDKFLPWAQGGFSLLILYLLSVNTIFRRIP